MRRTKYIGYSCAGGMRQCTPSVMRHPLRIWTAAFSPFFTMMSMAHPVFGSGRFVVAEFALPGPTLLGLHLGSCSSMYHLCCSSRAIDPDEEAFLDIGCGARV